MKESTNPYETPGMTLNNEGMGEHPPLSIVPAGQGLRFLNLVIDYLAQLAIGFGVGILVGLTAGENGAAFLASTPGRFIGIPILLAYYLFFEATTSRTLGKLLTGTKVVNIVGGKPSFGQILGRTFARCIPFEPFSFFGTPARGWHDSLTKTYVVKATAR